MQLASGCSILTSADLQSSRKVTTDRANEIKCRRISANSFANCMYNKDGGKSCKMALPTLLPSMSSVFFTRLSCRKTLPIV